MGQPFEKSRRFYLAFHQWSSACRADHAHVQRQRPVKTYSSFASPKRLSTEPRSSNADVRLVNKHQPRAIPKRHSHVTAAKLPADSAIAPSGSRGESDELIDEPVVVDKQTSTWTDDPWSRKSPLAQHARRWFLTQQSVVRGLGEDTAGHKGRERDSYREEGVGIYRQALGHLLNPVVVLTTCDGRPDGRISSNDQMDDRWHGATLSSFASLSLRPDPYIMFNMHVKSRTIAALRRQSSPRICVHLLNATDSAAETAAVFAATHEHSQAPFQLFRERRHAQVAVSDGVPRLFLSQDVRAWLTCSSDGDCVVKKVGDHYICVFRVDMIDRPPETGPGLSYYNGQYAMPFQTEPHGRVVILRDTGPAQASSTLGRDRLMIADQRRTFSTTPRTRDASDKLDPTMSKELVSDFLCHNPDHYSKKINRMLNLNQEADTLQAEMDQRELDGELTSGAKQELEAQIASKRRFVARQLALHAAFDLEYMLDRAHVSRSRIQYIESCIERGQAALIEEGRNLMEKIAVQGPSVQTKLVNRATLLQEEGTLRTALHRLQAFAEDDDQSDFYDD